MTIPLQRCLCCGYSLAGLPIAHQCPECGFPYDPRSTAIELHNETSYPQAIAIVIMGVMMLVGAWKKQSTFVLVIFLITAFEIVQAFLVSRHTTRLILDSRGVHRVRAGTVQKSISWDELAGLKYSRIDGALLAQTKGRATIALTRNAKIAKECRRDVERAWFEFHGNPLPAKETNWFA